MPRDVMTLGRRQDCANSGHCGTAWRAGQIEPEALLSTGSGLPDANLQKKTDGAAILVADVVGFSRLAGADEGRTLSRLRGLRSDAIDPAIAAHHGRTFKRTGDGSLIEFRSVVDAVRCAIEVRTGMVERNAGLPPERHIEFRVGIHLGDVVEEADGDLMRRRVGRSPLRIDRGRRGQRRRGAISALKYDHI